MVKNSEVENYTLVTADVQTNGRGQQSNSWVSEPHKNLTMSMFIDCIKLQIHNQKYLNFAISLAVYDLLFAHNIPDLKIKWPNDIMSANHKICGILIENSIQKKTIQSSIIGIGLNVNQIHFPEFIKNASSLKIIKNIDFSLDDLLEKLIHQLQKRISSLHEDEYPKLEQDYLRVLYKKNIPTMFKDDKANVFMGKIVGISSLGNLQVELEDESVKEFGVKEIAMVK